MLRRVLCLRIVCSVALALLALGLAAPCIAQQSASASDARIDQLYGAAKDAQARGDTAAAISSYQELIRVAPHLAAAYNNLGMLYLNAHDYPDAADVLRKGLAVNPHMASASALLGIALYESGNYAGSRTALESALKMNPADENAQLYLAKDLFNLKEMEAASTRLRALAEREPGNQEVWYLLGEVYMQLSEQALAKMNALNPNSPLVHEVSGEMMEDMKNYQGALVEYKKAVDMAPDRAGTHYRLGNIEWKLSEWDDALAQFQAELKVDPYNCRAWAQTGNILITQQSQPEQGLADIDQALHLCPDLAQAHVDRGIALVKLGRNQEAVAELKIAVHDNPDDPMPHFFWARAEKALGDAAGASAELQTYATLQARASEAVAARAAAVEKATQDSH
ncbi:MAG: tetratricopeptide repeat protein [Acidobacteriaceae bacterium]